MVRLSDIVSLTPTAAAQRRGIDYAGRSIHYTYDRMHYGRRLRSRLLRIVVGIVIEHAFESYLRSRGRSYHLRGRTHWRSTDRAEFAISGRGNVDIKGCHVYPYRGRNFPDWFLNAEGLVPCGQLKNSRVDAYVQAYLVADRHNHSGTHYHLGVLPEAWGTPQALSGPVEVVLQRPATHALRIDLAGEGAGGRDIRERLVVHTGSTRGRSESSFTSLQYVGSPAPPACNVRVTENGSGTSCPLSKAHFHDIWLDSPAVYFAAWGTKQQFEGGTYVERGSRTRVYRRTRTANRSVTIKDLQPLSTL